MTAAAPAVRVNVCALVPRPPLVPEPLVHLLLPVRRRAPQSADQQLLPVPVVNSNAAVAVTAFVIAGVTVVRGRCC